MLLPHTKVGTTLQSLAMCCVCIYHLLTHINNMPFYSWINFGYNCFRHTTNSFVLWVHRVVGANHKTLLHTGTSFVCVCVCLANCELFVGVFVTEYLSKSVVGLQFMDTIFLYYHPSVFIYSILGRFAERIIIIRILSFRLIFILFPFFFWNFGAWFLLVMNTFVSLLH